MSDDENFLGDGADLFKEPDGYYKPEAEPTFETFERDLENVQKGTPQTLSLRLLGSHPLWGHILWNAAKVFAHFLDQHKELIADKHVLELGAGAALPSIVTALNNPSTVVVTDYPDHDLMDNIRFNTERCLSESVRQRCLHVQGYLWGSDVSPLLQCIKRTPPVVGTTVDQGASPSETLSVKSPKFDVIIMCDLIFNHSQHHAMLRTCRECLSTDPLQPGTVYVFFTHHRPHLAHRDMDMFRMAREEYGFHVEEFMTKTLPPMFENDPGDRNVRATVHCYRMTLN
ncbi:Protein N-terminal and lysine N-methyltransferase efm7 [Dispira parvispora]|uniref:Protein N-terminal and lysine N-methyltransferase EFM7 n=1 Tax=Dispira parvispora TaxID=1520584 RepID=A0A9W8E7M5_9FUNG|nr:Protein N-terminal and lysine N-methyltransferase efm7 [Dispira parvispora]